MEKQLKVVSVIDDYKVALNAGSDQGIKVGQRYMIYTLSTEEIIDPDTKESLGFLEIVKGTGKVTNVQDKLCTIESTEYKILPKTIKRKSERYSFYPDMYEEEVEPEREQLPFEDPAIGDLAKRVN